MSLDLGILAFSYIKEEMSGFYFTGNVFSLSPYKVQALYLRYIQFVKLKNPVT